MQNLPEASVYEQEVKYMPWGKLITEITDIAIETKQDGRVLDLLCGPGYLLGQISALRPDLILLGVDLEEAFIEYAKTSYPTASFETADVLTWETAHRFDLIIVTGGLHHVAYEKQEELIRKISQLLAPGGRALVGDPYIADYSTETERKLAAAKLGHEYLAVTIEKEAPDSVVEAAIQLISNDVFKVEYKSSVKKLEPVFRKYFSNVEKHKTWPKKDSEYGDYYFVLSNSSTYVSP